MNHKLLILAALVWAVGSWYTYTCIIKGFCEKAPEPIPVAEVAPEPEPEPEPEIDLVPIINTVEPEPVVKKECEQYLFGFMRYGQRNNYNETLKLEKFLRDYRNEEVPLDGFYGRDDEAAVIRLQREYAADVLTPWGLRAPTGYVFQTTRQKINELYCNN